MTSQQGTLPSLSKLSKQRLLSPSGSKDVGPGRARPTRVCWLACGGSAKRVGSQRRRSEQRGREISPTPWGGRFGAAPPGKPMRTIGAPTFDTIPAVLAFFSPASSLRLSPEGKISILWGLAHLNQVGKKIQWQCFGGTQGTAARILRGD